MKILFFAILTSATCLLADKIPPTVRTRLGAIRGHWQLSRDGRQFQAYEGIPYALPPIGDRRFEPPEPIEEWIGEMPATKPSSVCLQYLHIVQDPNDRVTGSEDCLYLNVYTPRADTDLRADENVNDVLPVIVYIHSGAFQFGDGATHKPHYIMDHDVVFVSINYRLGPLGFLSTEDSIVPGNMGLKDQSLALAWISRNIRSFGGDPSRITIIGLSAGAASVHYHYLSPMSRGLFHRGMSISGTALDCWTQTEASLEKAKKLGAIMGCPTNGDNEKLIRCLKTRPAKSILEAEGEFMPWLYNPYTPFGPVVEKNSSRPFIDESPIDIMNSGKAADLPWITSVVSEEGLYPAAEFVANSELMSELNENWEKIAPYLLDFNYTIPRDRHEAVARRIKKHYLGDKPIDRKTAGALVHMIGDRLYVSDGGKAAKILARANRSPVRFYFFSYRGQHSLSDAFIKNKENFGVSHADDLAYVFTDWNAVLTSKQDLRMSQEMVKLWTSYARTGIPEVGIDWPRVDPSSQNLDYLHIAGPGNFTVEASANLGEKNFWSSIDFSENKPSRMSDSHVVQRHQNVQDESEQDYGRAQPRENSNGIKNHNDDWPNCQI